MPIILSKTDYIIFRECPKNAWMKIHKPEIYFQSELSEFEKHIIETGNEVELAARKLFPTGILVEGRGADAQKITQDYIQNKKSVLFQPVFLKEGFLAAVDILKFNKDTDSYSIYEVKASNEIDEKTHFYDLAFQVNLLRKAGLKVIGINLIHLNSEYIRSGDLDITKLFKIDNVSEEINKICDEVSLEMEKALTYLSNNSEPSGHCGCIYKGRSKHCSTFKHSNPQVPEYSVHDIARIGSSPKKLAELIDSGIFHIKDVPEHIKFSDIQKNQIDAHIYEKVLIKENKIAEEFENLTFPLYFLDYETFPCAIPRFDGFTPYQQIPFQYSLHILESPESELKHFEFLYSDVGDPSKSLIESLQSHIGDVGSIIVWSKKFECRINKELAERIPDASSFIESLNSRVYDLMDIFSKQHYVHKDFKGSASIKKVLPIIASELSYKNLNIKEGGAAAQSWNKIVSAGFDKMEKENIIQDLKKYCELDTYAMFAIWKNLRNLVE